jgi:homoserine O-acetyltransferase
MGGMHAWLWGEKYPAYMDALVPMASQPTAMASRNWMLRRMMLELIRNDPEYQDGNYTTQPRFLKLASVFFGIATAGGTLNYQKLAPTRDKADSSWMPGWPHR